MLRNFFVAVTSAFFLSGTAFALDPTNFTAPAFNAEDSSASMRVAGADLAYPARLIGITRGAISPQGVLRVDVALNMFGPNAELHSLRSWYDLLNRFEQPKAHISAQLDRKVIMNAMAGPESVFELPIEIEMNGISKRTSAKVSGEIQPDSSIALSTFMPVSLRLSDFDMDAGPMSTDLHFTFVYDGADLGPTPDLVASEKPFRIDPQLASVLRPRTRPTPPSAPRVVVTAKPRNASPKPEAKTKQLVTIRHTMRPKAAAHAHDCSEASRVTRHETLLEQAPDRGQNTKVDRALRKLVRAFMPCKN